MAFTEFEATLKKYVSDGKKVITLEVDDGALNGKMESLEAMMKRKVRISLESEVVVYNVQINAQTEKPIKSYNVDEHGIVSEVKPEGEQLELDLNVPKKKDPIKEVPEEIDREIVDEFILELLAPSFDDLPYPFVFWVQRLSDGDTYSKIASEFAMSSGKLVDLIDEYRARVAPLAAKWNEWRENGGAVVADADQSEDGVEDPEAEAGEVDPAEQVGGEDIVLEDGQQQEPKQSVDDELNDWEREIMGETEQPNVNVPEPTVEDLDEYILKAKPSFDDIPYDFPALLERKKDGETWMKIANSIGTSSGVLASAWTKYRKRVKELRNGGAA